MHADLLIKNCSIVTSTGRIGPDVGIATVGEKIAAIGTMDALPTATKTVDANGGILVPGIVDTHIHNRSPGYEYKEDWETATRAAAAGGVTSVIGMPNTDPPVDCPEHLRRKFDRGEQNAIVDFQSYAVLTTDNLDQIHPLAEAGVAGYKVFFGTYLDDIEPPSDGQLHAAMTDVAKTGRRLGVHAENREIIAHYRDRAKQQGRTDPTDYPRSRPTVAETEGVSRVVTLARNTACPVHIFQVSTGRTAAIIRDAKRDGIDVTAETTPHYLWFTEAAMETKGEVASIQPPLRSAKDRDSLWETGIEGGAIDCIGTDHSPHTDAEQGLTDILNIWDVSTGFVGLESEVPAMLTFVNDGCLTLKKWVDLHSSRPAKVWGLYPQKGSLQVGTDADFTIVDPTTEWILDRHDLQSKNTATPFDGEQFAGSVTHTCVRGSLVYTDGTVVGTPGDGRRISVDQ